VWFGLAFYALSTRADNYLLSPCEIRGTSDHASAVRIRTKFAVRVRPIPMKAFVVFIHKTPLGLLRMTHRFLYNCAPKWPGVHGGSQVGVQTTRAHNGTVHLADYGC